MGNWTVLSYRRVLVFLLIFSTVSGSQVICSVWQALSLVQWETCQSQIMAGRKLKIRIMLFSNNKNLMFFLSIFYKKQVCGYIAIISGVINDIVDENLRVHLYAIYIF